MPNLDAAAESYVRLTLALGEIDPYHVDAYYGPPAWKDGAKGARLEQIIDKAGEIRASISDAVSDPRAKSLAKQLEALIARAQLRAGQDFTFDEESSLVYDVVAPAYPDSHYQAIIDQIEPLLPGDGPLDERWENFRSLFFVPADKLESIFKAGVDAARERAKKFIPLPDGESFDIELVSGQVWGAYNWYKGQAHSLIQVNTDLPLSINRIVHLACHEGYPGHHVYNALLEQQLVRANGWMEFTVYPLYSPQSLIAEGTAEYGVDLSFPAEDRLEFERNVLYPMAGLDPSRAGELQHITKLMAGLANASNDAARRYIDGKASRDETIEWLQAFALASRKRAEQSIGFYDAHRSYTVTYDVGRQMVERYVEGQASTVEDRWRVFADLLKSPAVPSDLVA